MDQNINVQASPENVKAEADPAIKKDKLKIDDLTTTMAGFTVHSAFNDFLIRLQQLRSSHPDWENPRYQNRPFKATFIDFLHRLILRLPVAPEITPLSNGTVRLRYKKRAPRDKWQMMEFIVYPQRYFQMTAKSRIPNQPIFQRTNLARPDYISDMIQAFYELDYVNTKEHPIRFRKAVMTDYAYISALCQSTFGPHRCYHPSLISKLCQYCYVADDPMYGIVSVAAISEDEKSEHLKVNFIVTVQNYRGLSMASKCLRKCVSAALAEHPDAIIDAESPMHYDAVKDAAYSALRRAGFKRVLTVKGEKKYKCFDCDRCNILNGYCKFEDPKSVCYTVHYQLTPSSHHGK